MHIQVTEQASQRGSGGSNKSDNFVNTVMTLGLLKTANQSSQNDHEESDETSTITGPNFDEAFNQEETQDMKFKMQMNFLLEQMKRETQPFID